MVSAEDHLEERVIRPGINVKVSERSQLASREVQYSVRDVRDGSIASVALQCTDATIRMIDTVTLCSPLVGVRDCVTAASEKEGRKVRVIKWGVWDLTLLARMRFMEYYRTRDYCLTVDSRVHYYLNTTRELETREPDNQ